MKKLLALILCVMMFVAIIPTSAFAVDINAGTVPTASGKILPTWNSKKVAEDAVDAASDNIQALYQTLAADQGVFATVSAIDGVVTGIAKEIWKDADSFTHRGVVLSASAAEDATKALLRDVIGDEIMNYMNDHYRSYASVNAAGQTKIDPAKYMEAFATAASKAVSSDKAVANIQALVLSLAAARSYKDFLDDLGDLRDDITVWNDGKGAEVWQNYFGTLANGFADGQNVIPFLEGGDLYMDPYALFEPHNTTGGSNLDTSDYVSYFDAIIAHS